MAGRRKKQAARIAEMLADGHTVEAIAQATGASERTVYRHKADLRKKAGDAAVAEFREGLEGASGNPSPGPGRIASREVLIQWAYSVGMREDAINRALETGGDAFLSRRIQSLHRLATEKPDKWDAWLREQEAAEARERESTAIQREEFEAWVKKLVNHTARVMPEDDFILWQDWVEEMTTLQHPKLL